MKSNIESYDSQMCRLYKKDLHIINVTFQVTDSCPMKCTYCYQINKGHKFMSKETGKSIVDLLFNLYEINNPNNIISKNTSGIILEFIGGEPFANIELVNYISEYFFNKCYSLNHPWLLFSRINITSNGILYFNSEVQNYFKKFNKLCNLNISIDGPKEIHDSCRILNDGSGSYDKAVSALKHYSKNYNKINNTKVTIAPENLNQISKIVKFFIEDLNITDIHANCTFEAEWTVKHAKIFYQELKKMSNYLLSLNNLDDITVVLFNETYDFQPMDNNDNTNWCGGTGAMLAFNPDGMAYPCVRYMESSLGSDQSPLIIGDINGIYNTEKQKKFLNNFRKITRRSQSTDECFNCEIASGCGWCSAWNYQLYGTANKRCTRICWMHRARALANVYFWNLYYKQYNIDKHFKMYLKKETALQIIDEDEYNMLLNLSENI